MTNGFCVHSSVILVFISQVATKHQNNPLVSAEVVCHSSMYIILYFMPLPLGAGGIMFSGCINCPSVRPSVCPERFLGICWRTHRWNGLKFCMLMYLDHLQNGLDYGHGLLIFVLLAQVWLSETGQIWGCQAFPGERMEGMGWNSACWCILTTFRTGQFMVTVWWFFIFWHYFDLVKRVKFGVSGHFLENAWREWPEILHAVVSSPPSELIRSWSWSVYFFNFDTFLT